MTTAQAASGFLAGDLNWGSDWAWGLPLIVTTVLIHVFGLVLINQRAARASRRTIQRRHPTTVFVVVMGLTTLSVSVLHGIEAGMWAAAYRSLGALPDIKSAMLYSLNAITSYGHIELHLESRSHLMGALEALNGWLLFGLTTAFLFAMIQKVLLNDHLEHR
jgi:hypothetical protein